MKSEGETLRSGRDAFGLGGVGPAGPRGKDDETAAGKPPVSNASPPKPKASPPRRKKHVPQRMCVACRERDTKRGLHRIVRTPEGGVEPDPTGRRNGRGAYLCGQAACWEKALASGILARALNVDIDTETIDALRQYAATLPLESSTAVGAAQKQRGER